MYSFSNFNKIDNSEKKQVFNLRNDPYVRKWSYDTRAISWKEHLFFFKELKSDKTKMYFFVKRNNLFIGVYSIRNIKNHTGQGGFYISPEAVNKKLAVEFIFYSIQYIFESTHIEKIYGLEDTNNKNAFTINQLFGFYDKQQNHIREINGLNYRYGELTNYDFKSVAKNPKVDFLIKYSKTIIL